MAQLTPWLLGLRKLSPPELLRRIGDVFDELGAPPDGDPDALAALATAHRTASAALTGTAAEVFTTAATVLDEFAQALRAHRDRHAELTSALRAAALNPLRWARVPDLAGDLVDVHTEAIVVADLAASRFDDLAARARVAAGVRGGLGVAQARELAAHLVDVLPGANGFDDGVLSAAGLERAGHALASLGPAGRAAVRDLLDRAGSGVERAWLVKALAAGHTDLGVFAEAIRGRDAAWLGEHLTLIDRGGPGRQVRLGHVVRQYEATTCGTTSVIVARAERDPVYCLGLTSGDFATAFTAERARVHDETNRVHPKALGTSPAGVAEYLTRHTGVDHGWRAVDDTDRRRVSAVLRDVLAAVDRGYPVPLLLGSLVPRHYVLAVGHHDGVVLLFEPTAGVTVSVPVADFHAGRLAAVAGFDHVQAVVLPEPILTEPATRR